MGNQSAASGIENLQKEHLKVVKEASAGLLALLEDDQTKLEVRHLAEMTSYGSQTPPCSKPPNVDPHS